MIIKLFLTVDSTAQYKLIYNIWKVARGCSKATGFYDALLIAPHPLKKVADITTGYNYMLGLRRYDAMRSENKSKSDYWPRKVNFISLFSLHRFKVVDLMMASA